MTLSARVHLGLLFLLCLAGAGITLLFLSSPEPESRDTAAPRPETAPNPRRGGKPGDGTERPGTRGGLTEREKSLLDDDLLSSAYVGTPEEVRMQLAMGADPNTRNFEEQTPLHRAALRDDDGVAVADALLAAGAQIDAEDWEDLTPLDLALVSGKDALALFLLRRGTVLPANPERSWELWAASDTGNSELVRTLVDRDQDPNWTTADGWNALCLALETGHAGIASILEKAGARIPNEKAQDLDLVLACRRGDVRAAAAALDRGADVDVAGPSGETPAGIAIDLGNRPVLEVLAARGAAVDGAAPLLEAARAGHVPVVEFLLDRGGDVNTRVPNPAIDVTLLHIAASNGYRDLVAFLLARGADVNGGGPGSNPLHDAVENGHAPIVSILLARGADFRSPDENGRTPLHKAVKYPSVLEILLARGADPNPKDCFGETPLHLAAGSESGESLTLLVNAGADLDARDHDGETPLVDAVRAFHPGKTETVRFLLDKGADVNVLTKSGKSALDHAREEDDEGLVRLLLRYGPAQK